MLRKKVFIALLVKISLGLVVLLCLAVSWHVQRATVTAVESTICYARGSFVSSDGNDKLLNGLEKRDNKYCGVCSDVLDRIVKKTVVEKYNTNLCPELTDLNLTTVGCIPSQEKKPILQLENVASHATPVQGKATQLYWKSGRRSAPGLVHLEKEGVVYINQSGQYYVSTQVTLKSGNVPNNESGIGEEHTFKHFVYHIPFEKRSEKVLLQNVKSPCDNAIDHSEQTSNMAAVFSLGKHDRIYVATSHPNNLVTGHARNYLYLHSI